jgi:hypothetical protein
VQKLNEEPASAGGRLGCVGERVRFRDKITIA